MTESPFYTGDKYHLPEPKPKSTSLLAIFAGIVGMFVGRYVGINFLIPGIFIGISYLIYQKLLFKNRELFFIEAAVLLCGHAAWGIAGVIILELNDQGLETLPTIINIVEFSIYLAFSIFLLKSPNFALPAVLILIEVLLLVLNTVGIADQPLGTDNHKALTAHIALRVGIVLGAFSGLRKLNEQAKKESAKKETEALETDQNGS